MARNLISYGEAEGANDIEAVRIAILPSQTTRLPSAPPKATDNRGFDEMLLRVSSDDEVGDYTEINPNMTWQLEALPPDELARIVRQAIEQRLDQDAYDEVLAEEREVREEVLSRLGGGDEPEPDDDGRGPTQPQPRPWVTRPTR